jgi:periplasmic iron binding protein
VNSRWTGPILVGLIFLGVILILAINLNLKGRNPSGSNGSSVIVSSTTEPSQPASPAGAMGRPAADFREYPIGDEVEKNQIRIKAVYLPPVKMDGMPDPMSSGLIHLEADIHAGQGNRNGFAEHEFVPYLLVHFTIVPADTKTKLAEPIQDDMTPMVARDGLHYGANIEMPKAGHYKLTFAIQPPSKGGLGRHADPATGVEPWWKPFEVSFDWEYPGVP